MTAGAVAIFSTPAAAGQMHMAEVAEAVGGGRSAVAGAQRPAADANAAVAGARFELDQRSAVSNRERRAEDLYEAGRDELEEGRYERAIERFEQLIALKTGRTDAALYWKAYSLGKIGNRPAALETLAELEQQTASRWLKDAQALAFELKQASGQALSPDSQDNDELKLLALRGLMQSDPEQAFPVIEQMLSGANSPRVKDRALFVVSQSRSPRARDLIVSVARGAGNPDLQLRAIRYMGVMGGADNRQILADVYRSSNDTAVKRSILRSFMTAGDRDRLFALAKTEGDATLRGEAVRQLGVMSASAELAELYRTEVAVEVKRSILQSMHVGGDAIRLIEIARTEKDPDLRRTAIRNVGLINRPETTEALIAIYGSDSSVEVRKAVVNALFVQGNAAGLVSLARQEPSAEVKRDIVSKLSNMKSKTATDYLLELLK